MIRVKILKSFNGNILKYLVDGHAGYSRKGNDIVCSAVSMLSQTTLVSLNEVCGIDENEIYYHIDDNKGHMEVSIPSSLDSVKMNKAQIVMKTFETGIKLLIDSYGEYVTLENGEV